MNVVYSLQHQNSGHCGKTESTVYGANGGCAGLVAARRAGWGVASCARVSNGTDAVVLSADELLVLKGLVERACSGDVLARLQVEGTSDIVELSGRDTVVC